MSEGTVSPAEVLASVAAAIPSDVRSNIIIIGSLAAGYRLLPNDREYQVRTKDIDCVLSPRLEAVRVGVEIAETLLQNGWTPREEGKYGKAGTVETPDEDLPAVRLHPPGERDFFIELLTLPEESQSGKRWTRLALASGDHYGLPSFEFVRVAVFRPAMTPYGVWCACPEFMALANLLENSVIRPALIEAGAFAGFKRSNKDLGRVLAIALLTSEDELETWPVRWLDALKENFPETWRDQVPRVGNGLHVLIASPGDLDEATRTCARGLLASQTTTSQQLMAAGSRLLEFQIADLEALAVRM